MTEIVLVVVLGLVLLAYALAPVRARSATVPTQTTLLRAELTARKRSALEAILDMEGERDVGKLSAADFAVLRREYEGEVVAAMIELDRLTDGDAVTDADLEAEIAALRATLTCPACGAARGRGRVCKRCGSA